MSGPRTRSKSLQKKRQQNEESDDDSEFTENNETESDSESGRTVQSSSNSEHQEDNYSDSEYDPNDSIIANEKRKSKGNGNRNKRNNRNNRMSIDEDEDEEDEEEEEEEEEEVDFNHLFEKTYVGQDLPESVVYMKSDINSSIKPDPRLFDIVNDEINHNDDDNDDDEGIINKYIAEYNDNRIRKEHFDDDKYGMLDIEEVESLYLQRDAMNKVMNKIDENIANLLENADRNIFDDIVKFAQNSYRKSNDDINITSNDVLWDLKEHLIPTAVLMCGQNVSDHPLHFERLQKELYSNVTPLIVRFTQNDLKKTGSFSTKLYDIQKFIINNLLKSLSNWKVLKVAKKRNISPSQIRTTRATKNEDIYFDIKRLLKLPTMTSIKYEMIRSFLFWYFEHSRNINKYWKEQKGDNYIESCFNGLPKIIIMIDCIEHWSPKLLSSLIYTLYDMNINNNISSNIHIPFLLILGVSTTEDLLSKMIEIEASYLIQVNMYYFEASFKIYKKLAEKILIESSPILFDCCILNNLLNHCELNDYSVSRFKDQIRYLFMSYFMNTKASQYAAYLMHLKQKYNDNNNIIKKEDEKEKDNKDENEYNLCWFDKEENYIEDLLKNTEFNEGDTYEQFEEYIKFTFKVYERYRESLKIFKMITDHLNLKWSQTEIIAKLQNKELLYKYLLCVVGGEHHQIKISTEERDDFPPRIRNFEKCHYIYKILEEKTKLFDPQFADKASKQYKIIRNRLDKKPDIKLENKPNRKLNTKQKRLALKRQLTGQTNKNLYDEARLNLFELLTSFICKHLKPMNELPLNQIFVYSKEYEFCDDMFPPKSSKIRKRFENLNDHYIEPEAINCIYDIYHQSSVYINLHDAYIAFKEIFIGFEDNEDHEIEKKQKIKKKEKKHKKQKNRNLKEEMSTDDDTENDDDNNNNIKVSKSEKKSQIQFRMSIDDLRFCGFIKATNRKKEVLIKMADLL